MLWYVSTTKMLYIIQFYFRSTLVYTVYILTRYISLQYDRLQKMPAPLLTMLIFSGSITSQFQPVTIFQWLAQPTVIIGEDSQHGKNDLSGTIWSGTFFWKSTSQLVTKLWIDHICSYFPNKKFHCLDPSTPRAKTLQTAEAVYIDVSDSKGQDPECRRWCSRIHFRVMPPGALTLESMHSLVYMHAGVLSGCISRRLID